MFCSVSKRGVWCPKHRRSQDFLYGCTFSFSESLRSFLVVVLNTQVKRATLTTPTLQLSPPSKNFIKNYLSSFSAWGAFTTCPYKLRQKQFFSALGGAPTAPPWLRLWSESETKFLGEIGETYAIFIQNLGSNLIYGGGSLGELGYVSGKKTTERTAAKHKAFDWRPSS